MPPESPEPIERAMVVAAHPDDPEFGAGGTVAAWSDAGVEVTYVIVTDGSKGSDDRSHTPESLVALREQEQRAAAEVLGVARLRFLGLPDGELRPNLALRHRVTAEIRRWRPDVLVTHDPATFYFDRYINHPDHRAVGEATLAAVFPTARDFLNAPQLLEEGLEPHKVREVYLTISREPDHFVDIGATIERKLEALRQHASQIQDMEGLAERMRERHRSLAEGRGMELAEAFKRIRV